MRRRFFFLLAALTLVTLVPSAPAREHKPAPGIAGLSWMAGSWRGEHDGGMIEEHWMAPNGRGMMGMARLVVDGKTPFYEFLRIEERDDGSIVYLAQPKGRCPPVEFQMTSGDVGKAVFENPRHDNPRIIRYSLTNEGKTMVAVTEGVEDGKPQIREIVMQTAALAEDARPR